jgi:photosystem II stability/assembly factor-like uncharacterized protein
MSRTSFKLFGVFIFFIFGFQSETTFSQSNNETYFSSLEYRLLGPFRGGRSAAVAGVSDKPNLFYFGATGGGVWKTEDGGRQWKNISDGFFGGSIGSIAVSEDDSNVLYVGGGESTVRGNVSSGYGVWKTENAGKSWESVGLENSRHIPRLVVHPRDHQTVYAAVLGNIYKPSSERGIYKSTDGGKTWNRKLFVNENAGAVDLIMDPTNPRILYASTWNIRRTPYSLSSGGEGSALWKSVDSGETWKEISKNGGFAEGILGNIGVAISPVNNDVVWAIVENKDKGGVYKSMDGGSTWTYINSERKLRQRAWYYSRIYADPQDVEVVYVLNVRYHKSIDGGKTYSTHNAPHGDHHDLWIAPENPKRMIMGDDGGAQITYDGGETWSTYHNQPTAQFYRVTTDDAFPYRIYAAQQDNSTIRISHRNENWNISEDDWEETAGGESAHITIDPTNNDIVYGGSYDGFLTRYNHQTKTLRSVSVWPDNPMGHGAEEMKYRFQWNFPMFFSKHNPKKLYTFSNHVHVSENEGHRWKVISPDLTRNDSTKLKSSGGPITQDNTSVEYYCTIFAAAESPLKEGLLWVGSDDGLVHLSKDAGETWENVTPKGMPDWMMINSIEPSNYDEGTCYIAGTKYKTGDFTPYLYKTKDYGKTWKKITNGIPSEHFTRVLREDPEKEGFLYTGTETGLYYSHNEGSYWQPLQLNLPIVPITDLAVKNNNLVVATQGRSLWILDDLSILHQASEIKGEENVLFKPKDTYRMRGGSYTTSLTKGTNHPSGVITHFYVKNPNDKEIKLSYLNSKNDTIKTLNTRNKNDNFKVIEGSNTYVWNTRGESAEKFDGMILWWASLEAPRAVPGVYKVVLNIDGEVYKKEFNILANPNSESDTIGMQKQFDFITGINFTINNAHKSIKKIRAIDRQLLAFQNQYKDDNRVAELNKKAKQLSEEFSKIEKAMYQTQNKSGQDPLNFPIKLTNKLGHLNSLVGMGDFPPTEQDIAVKDELTLKINLELEKFNILVSTKIKEFNTVFNSLNLNYLLVE